MKRFKDFINESVKISPKDRKIVDKKTLAKGANVEREHTTNRKKAETIALQHIKELPKKDKLKKGVLDSDYYKELDKIEKKLKESESLFDPEFQRKTKAEIYKHVFKDQDEMAARSEVFNNILQREIHSDPEKRYKQTNSSESKTRNALLTRRFYKTQKEWEDNLLTNPFYQLKESLQQLSISDLNLETDGELLGEYVLPNELDIKLPVKLASYKLLETLRGINGKTISECFKTATRESIIRVKRLIKNFSSLNEYDKVIILSGNIIIDGYHRTIAAIKLKESLYYIDLKDLKNENT